MIDGGGIRGLSPILILKYVMARVHEERAEGDELEP